MPTTPKPLKGFTGQDLSVDVFKRYSKNGKMSAEGLLDFLQKEQGEEYRLEDVKRLMEEFCSKDFSREDFFNYLLSTMYNSCLRTDVYQDMTQPVSHYWIFTGHNSYLTGNQLNSDELIKKDLTLGVRGVELNLWPDDKGGIKVTHGNKFTNPVSLEKCLIAIKENAFSSSAYPVWVTKEDLTSPLQEKAPEHYDTESKLKDICEEFPEEVVKFTQRNILRVYPAGSRVDSSNYNPIMAWNHGAQMVAQNMQGYGKELWLAHGKFRGNGGCGYILKPKFMLENSPTGEAFNPLKFKHPEIKLKVKVMMTLGWDKAFSKRHFDLFSPPDFFTRVLVAGVPADVQKWKTSAIENEWQPHWNEETVFPLKVPELALMRFEVRDQDKGDKCWQKDLLSY